MGQLPWMSVLSGMILHHQPTIYGCVFSGGMSTQDSVVFYTNNFASNTIRALPAIRTRSPASFA